MASVDQFIQYLKLNKSKSSKADSTILSLLKFISNSSELELNTHFLIDLAYLFLQSNPVAKDKAQFIESLNLAIDGFAKQCPCEVNQPAINKILNQQVIAIENELDLITIVGKSLSKLKESHKIKLKIVDKKVMTLILDNQSRLSVRLYNNKVKIASGELTPLRPVTHLKYDAHMELKPGENQYLASQDYIYSFRVLDQSVKGLKLSPRDLMIKQSLAGALNHECDIFFLLKSIEKNFIDLASDPFYQELCGKIDLAIDSLKSRKPESILFAKKSIKLAYLALKYVFDDDNYLKYKLLELERTIKSEVQWEKQSEAESLS